MTQQVSTTHLLPAIISAATGVNLAPADQTLDLIRDLSGGTIPSELSNEYRDQIRAELTRQLPWLARIEIPDFSDPNETRICMTFIRELTEAGVPACAEIEPGTLTGPAVPEVPSYAKIGRKR